MDDVGWCLVAVLLLTGTSLFFAIISIALRELSRVKLQEAYKEANLADRSDEIGENQERLVVSSSFYWRFFSVFLFLGLFILFIELPEQRTVFSYVLFLVVAVILTMSIQILAHTWAKYAGEVILTRTYPLVKFLSFLARPFIAFFELSDIVVRRLAGVADPAPEDEQEEKQEEFLNEVQEHRLAGAFDEEERQMIERVLSLDETAVEKIMTPRTDVIALAVQSDLQTVLDKVLKEGHSRIPVYEETVDNIIGMVYAKDLLAEIGADPQGFDLRGRLREAYFVPETKTVRVLLHEFQNQKLHIAVVLDEYGGTAGIVTLEDIVEELVGEIEDEYEESQPEPVQKIDENTFDVDARLHIDDLNNDLDVELPEDEDYDTLGGFIFSTMGYVPKTGESFEHDTLRFTISHAEARYIKRVRVEKLLRQNVREKQQ